jgi:two-component system, NtrC family, response regulator GlrR
MKSHRTLLIGVAAEKDVTNALRDILEPNFKVQIHSEPIPDGQADFADLTQTLKQQVQTFSPHLIFLLSGLDQPQELKKLVRATNAASRVPIIVVVKPGDPDTVLKVIKAGAADFISSPLMSSDVLPRAWRLVQGEDSSSKPVECFDVDSGPSRLIGKSSEFRVQVEQIASIAKCGANVLLLGETGTGKELFARALHYSSPRASKPFIPVNCGALPIALVENELFGHARGAFTSASDFQVGVVAEANGGTLFLDEIDCLPQLAQIKLLRFLQEKEYRPLGSPKIRRADVRVIAASNLNLEEAVAQGRFRQDLFYRLNIISLSLPPLRDRQDDIPLLAAHFLEKYSREFGKDVTQLSADALEALLSHRWPGNIRELEHAIERAVVLCRTEVIQFSDLGICSGFNPQKRESLQVAKAKEIARFEKNYIKALLSACHGNITKAAQMADKNRRAFWQLIHKHQIDAASFKPGVS